MKFPTLGRVFFFVLACACLRFLDTTLPSTGITQASSVLRASPPSQSVRPFSHELPVDPHYDHRWDFPCRALRCWAI